MLAKTTLSIAAAAALGILASTAGGAADLDAGDAEAIRDGFRAIVDDGHAAGVVTLVVQHGETVVSDAYGLADMSTGAPMEAGAVMRIASMTKPVTGVAMMMLYEDGLWSFDDPIAKHLPELADLEVMAEGGLVDPQHAPTMGQLVSHTAGFTYGYFGVSEVDQAYLAANVLDESSSLEIMIGKLAAIPLKHQPGTAWEYSVSADIQGAIVERLSGMPFDAFLRERIFEPLGMVDTDFAVLDEDARGRIAMPHYVADGALTVETPPAPLGESLPGLPSGGGGLWSTAADYARFCQMLLNGGELDGVRLLEPETVALMREDLLPEGARVTFAGPGTGFGVDFAVAADPAESGEPWPEGTYYWFGIYGTFFWIDPANDLFAIGMIQRAYNPQLDPTYSPMRARNMGRAVVYQALAD